MVHIKYKIGKFAYLFILIIFISCNRDNLIEKKAISYLIDSVLFKTNFKNNIKIYYKFDEFVDLEYLNNLSEFEEDFNFEFKSFKKQLNTNRKTNIKHYILDTTNIILNNKYYNINTNECLFIISPPFFSKNNEYILFIIKYIYNIDNNLTWSYNGVILKNNKNNLSFETLFIDEKKIKNNFINIRFSNFGGSLMYE